MSRREFPDHPIIGVGGIVISDDRVLLVRRAKEPLLGQWSIPGGALELGESRVEGVEREILEETALVVKAVSVVEVLDRVLRHADGRVQYHYVLIDYLCHPADGRSEPRAGSDVSEACWVSREKLGEYGLRAETLAVIEKAFGVCR